jgi:glycosyltransferase involved in cell wall biosynthesis
MLAAMKGSTAHHLPLVSVPMRPNLKPSKRFLKRFAKLLRRTFPYSFDIISAHGSSAYLSEFFPHTPIVNTMHGGFGERILDTDVPVFVSKAQKKHYLIAYPHLKDSQVIYNPIHMSEFKFRQEKEDYLLFIAKLDWRDKGIDSAIDIARKTNHRLILAGPNLPKEHRNILDEQFQYAGEVYGKEKAELLANAKAVLLPSRLPEAFGLVAAEANASGTPAIVLNNGGMPEVVNHNETGFVCNSVDEMAEAVQSLSSIKPKRCEEWVRKNFDHHLISKQTIDYYYKLVPPSHISLL